MGPTARMTVGAVGTGLAALAALVFVLRSAQLRPSPLLRAIGGNELLWASSPAAAMRRELMASAPSEIRILASHRPTWSCSSRHRRASTGGGRPHPRRPGGAAAAGTGRDVLPGVAPGGRRCLHRVAGNSIYVSTGVGLVRQQAPQVRFLTRPSVGVVTLR